MDGTSADCQNLGNIPDNNKILLTNPEAKKPFKTCVVCGPDHRAYGYCISCMELLCAECVRAHKQVGMTSKHNIAEVKQYLYPENNESKCAEVVCDYCGPQTCAVVHCSDCYEFLCEYCLKDHKRVKLTSNHKLIDIQQLTIPSETSQKFICESHNKIGLCTCDTCEATVLCHQCLPAHHNHLLRKPQNFQLFLPSFITWFRKRAKIEEGRWYDSSWGEVFNVKKEVDKDRKWMRKNVYNERIATKQQKAEYSKKFRDMLKKHNQVVETKERSLTRCKQLLKELPERYNKCLDDDIDEKSRIYNQLLEVQSVPFPYHARDMYKFDPTSIRTTFRESLAIKPASAEDGSSSDSEVDEQPRRTNRHRHSSVARSMAPNFFDYETDPQLSKQQLLVKYADIFNDHKTKTWQTILKEAEDMVNNRFVPERSGTRKAWSAMALCVRKIFVKLGVSVVSPNAINKLLSIVTDINDKQNFDTDYIESYLLPDRDYFDFHSADDTCRLVSELITYLEGVDISAEFFYHFIKIHYHFNSLRFDKTNKHLVGLSGVNYECCCQIY